MPDDIGDLDRRTAAGQLHAVELAQTGFYERWFQIEHTMRWDEGEPEASLWLADPGFRDALDAVCQAHWAGLANN
jgi:hypothetical protein